MRNFDAEGFVCYNLHTQAVPCLERLCSSARGLYWCSWKHTLNTTKTTKTFCTKMYKFVYFFHPTRDSSTCPAFRRPFFQAAPKAPRRLNTKRDQIGKRKKIGKCTKNVVEMFAHIIYISIRIIDTFVLFCLHIYHMFLEVSRVLLSWCERPYHILT